MPSDSLTPLSCGCCGGPSRVNVAGLHLAVTFPCGWCGKVTMVRCTPTPQRTTSQPVPDAFSHWERSAAADAREDCKVARYRSARR